jgi:rhodanese-related sulfurtransferase
MKTERNHRLLLLTLMLLTLMACGKSPQGRTPAAAPGVSGRLEAGLRVLTFDSKAQDQRLRVYRGDYVRPELNTGEPFTLEIPALKLVQRFPGAADEPTHFKVPDAGSFEFRIGAAGGTIEAVEYRAATYREVSAKEAALQIANLKPVIVDVRTPGEFAGGHLEGAVLIPVQEFQRRLGELAPYKQAPIFVYCRSGNRSTVAAKLLVDSGFENVINLRRGIVDWTQEGLPVVK